MNNSNGVIEKIAQKAFNAGLEFAHYPQSNESGFRFRTWFSQNKPKNNEPNEKNKELLNLLKEAQDHIYKLGDKFCRNKNGYLKEKDTMWNAELDIRISAAIYKAEKC